MFSGSGFWTKILDVLSAWSGSEVPQTPELCLLGDRSQMPDVPKGVFTVVVVGLVTACRIILKHLLQGRAQQHEREQRQ